MITVSKNTRKAYKKYKKSLQEAKVLDAAILSFLVNDDAHLILPMIADAPTGSSHRNCLFMIELYEDVFCYNTELYLSEIDIQ